MNGLLRLNLCQGYKEGLYNMFYVVILHPGIENFIQDLHLHPIFCDGTKNSWTPEILFISKISVGLVCQFRLFKSIEMRIFEAQENHRTVEREFNVPKSSVHRGFHKLLYFQAYKLTIVQELQMTKDRFCCYSNKQGFWKREFF